MTATHQFPKPTVSFRVTTSAEPTLMFDWTAERLRVREFLQPLCANAAEYEFWDDFFTNLTGMFDRLETELFLYGPMLWHSGGEKS